MLGDRVLKHRTQISPPHTEPQDDPFAPYRTLIKEQDEVSNRLFWRRLWYALTCRQ